MTVGSLGDVVFYVNDKHVKTIQSMSWKIAISYSEHKMHRKKSLLEYTGQSPEEIEISADFSAFLGVNPLKQIKKLKKQAVNRSVVPFVLGTDVIMSACVITDISPAADMFYLDGTMIKATVKIKIKEYGE